MKTYTKPTLQVINMKTSENIADNDFIKTMYTKTAESNGQYQLEGLKPYDAGVDLFGSAPAPSIQ